MSFTLVVGVGSEAVDSFKSLLVLYSWRGAGMKDFIWEIPSLVTLGKCNIMMIPNLEE